MDDIKSIIDKIKKSITSMEENLAIIYTNIDSLECYPNNDEEIENLEKQTSELEAQIGEKKRQLQLYNVRFAEIKKVKEEITKAKKEKEFLLRQEKNNGSDLTIIFEIGALNQTIRHLRGKLKHLSNLNNIK